jgi:tetratricopeptide (TPR) repeat protein
MRKTLIALAATLLVGLAATPGLRAGVYSTAEPSDWPLPLVYPQYRLRMGDLRSIGVNRTRNDNEKETPHERGLRLAAGLEEKGRKDGLTVEDRINLGAYYIRLLKYEEAVKVLTAAEAQEPRNFMVLANLASAHHGAGRLDRALAYQQQVLGVWPEVNVGFDMIQLRWYRRAERYYLRLLQLREQESRLQPARGAETVDALFGPLRFTGPNGQYEPGNMPSDQWEQLPGDWLMLLTQLTLWLPFDDRLYWLMAELINVQGSEGPQIAFQMMDELVYGRRFAARECLDHRRTLKQAEEMIGELTGDKGRVNKEKLLGVVLPRGVGLAPGADPLLQEAIWCGLVQVFEAQRNGAIPPIETNPTPPPQPTEGGATTPPPAFWQPDVRHLVVSFLAGVAVTMLLVLQVRANRARGKTAAG